MVNLLSHYSNLVLHETLFSEESFYKDKFVQGFLITDTANVFQLVGINNTFVKTQKIIIEWGKNWIGGEIIIAIKYLIASK